MFRDKFFVSFVIFSRLAAITEWMFRDKFLLTNAM